jgi:enamine deaminase RidA (YjgF/YER057c/UK114 family)
MMRKTLFPWLSNGFVALSAEAQVGGTAGEQASDVFDRFALELRSEGLSLADTVRTRLWARDRKSRDGGSRERVAALAGDARSASSSYIAPAHFESSASVAVDLLAMRPHGAGTTKVMKEYDPPIVPLRHLTSSSFVFLSGVTSEVGTLADQMADILPRIEGSLVDAGASWAQVVHVSFHLHTSCKVADLRALFQDAVSARVPSVEYAFVEGYSLPGKLIEIEVTANKG